MNAEQIKEIATGVVPALIAAVVACMVILAMRKGKPLSDARGAWVCTLLLGLGCAAGAVWAGGSWKPGPSGMTWLPTMALAACAAGLVRGESERTERAGIARRVVVALALAAAAWMTVRSVAAMDATERIVVMAGLAMVGSVACWGVEQTVRDSATRRGGWPAAATGLVLGFGASQVLIIGMEVHAAAWVAAGVSAFFGVCLTVGLGAKRAFAGRGALTTACVLLCGLLVHGWQYGNTGGTEAAVYGSLLALSAVGPAVAAKVLGERGRGWGGLVACVAPAVAAAVTAAVLRPPPIE